MTIDHVDLYTVTMQMRSPFITASSTHAQRTLLLVAIRSGDLVGWGECSADGSAYCLGENAATASETLRPLAQTLIGADVMRPTPPDLASGQTMALSALDAAHWDLYAKAMDVPLVVALGGRVRPIPSRAVLGRHRTYTEQAGAAVNDGYRFLKIKLSPADSLDAVEAIRRQFPDVGLSVDLNGSLSGEPLNVSFIERLDHLGLDFIEQPFNASDDQRNRALLERSSTPICLDESVRTVSAAAKALDQGFLVNAKTAKFGGPSVASAVERSQSVWWGGMYETVIGRAHSLAVASLGHEMSLATDLGASERYYQEDCGDPVTLSDGNLESSAAPGIGISIDQDRIDHLSRGRHIRIT